MHAHPTQALHRKKCSNRDFSRHFLDIQANRKACGEQITNREFSQALWHLFMLFTGTSQHTNLLIFPHHAKTWVRLYVIDKHDPVVSRHPVVYLARIRSPRSETRPRWPGPRPSPRVSRARPGYYSRRWISVDCGQKNTQLTKIRDRASSSKRFQAVHHGLRSFVWVGRSGTILQSEEKFRERFFGWTACSSSYQTLQTTV